MLVLSNSLLHKFMVSRIDTDVFVCICITIRKHVFVSVQSLILRYETNLDVVFHIPSLEDHTEAVHSQAFDVIPTS